jgi:hypothetical protein
VHHKIVLINLLKPSSYFMYHQVQHSKILHGAHFAFMCFVQISEQTATFALYNINRLVLYNQNQGGECLLHSTHWVLT